MVKNYTVKTHKVRAARSGSGIGCALLEVREDSGNVGVAHFQVWASLV